MIKNFNPLSAAGLCFADMGRRTRFSSGSLRASKNVLPSPAQVLSSGSIPLCWHRQDLAWSDPSRMKKWPFLVIFSSWCDILMNETGKENVWKYSKSSKMFYSAICTTPSLCGKVIAVNIWWSSIQWPGILKWPQSCFVVIKGINR